MAHYILEKSSADRRATYESIVKKQEDRKPFNSSDVGQLIMTVPITLMDFSDCVNKHYSNSHCHHIRDEGNPANQPLNKKMVTIQDKQLHKATNVRLSLTEILTILNSHREKDFVEYDTNDWLEGLQEWTYLRLPEWDFYPMFYRAIELGHGIATHDGHNIINNRINAEMYPTSEGFAKARSNKQLVKKYTAHRRTCSCERQRQLKEKNGGYYASIY